MVSNETSGMQGMIEPVLGLLIALLLILGNGFFVAAEFALVASDRTRIERLAEEGSRPARATLKALRTLSFQLSGAQLGITITSLVLGFVVEPTIGRALEPLVERLPFVAAHSVVAVSVGVALAIATATQMIMSELIPQNLAIARPLQTAFVISLPLRLFNATFGPLIRLLNATANGTVRLLGFEPRNELEAVHSLEELELLIRSSREGGVLGEEDFTLLERSINFADKIAADALVPRTAVDALARDTTLADLTEMALETGHSRFPVYEGDLDNVLGMVHIKDMYAVDIEARDEVVIASIMQPPFVVPESLELDALLSQMRRERKQMAIVVDEYGGTAGIVTLEDLLEEIVGEIEDEYDPGTETTLTGPTIEGVSLLSGMFHPDEVRAAVGLQIPEGDYETLAGFLLTLFDRIPSQGDHTTWNDWEFKVVEMDGNRISRVLVVAPDADEDVEP